MKYWGFRLNDYYFVLKFIKLQTNTVSKYGKMVFNESTLELEKFTSFPASESRLHNIAEEVSMFLVLQLCYVARTLQICLIPCDIYENICLLFVVEYFIPLVTRVEV